MSMSKSGPISRAETLARHYVAHAMIAQHCLKLIELRRHSGVVSEDLDAMIQQCTDQIKKDHMHTFGILLEWPLP